MARGNEMLIVLLVYADDIITAHTRSSSLRDEWPRDFSSHFRWTDFGTNLQKFVSIRLRQSPGVIRLDFERYITELASEVCPGGIQAHHAMPARPELPSFFDEAVRRKGTSSNMMNLDRQT
eukprot:6177697-Pleurochrysis_carterae.AAC.2